MTARSNKRTGQQLDNSPGVVGTGAGTLAAIEAAAAGDVVARPGAGRLAITGHPPQVRASAVIGTGAGRLAIAGAAATVIVVNPLPAGPGLAAQIHQICAELNDDMGGLNPQHFYVRWSAVFDQLKVSFSNRGPNYSPERDLAFEAFDSEVAAGRDVDDRNLAGALARSLITDPRTIRRWRKEWKKERGRN